MQARASAMTPEAYANMSKAHTLMHDLPKLAEMTGEAEIVKQVGCDNCGRKFLPAGLASHRIKCANESIPVNDTCKACGATVKRYGIKRHSKTCKGVVK